MKLTLTYVGRFTTNKSGQPLVSAKTGRPYTALRIKCNEYGDKYLSGFDNTQTAGWKIGDVVEADVEQKGEYLNFSVPKQSAPDVNRLEIKVDAVLAEIQTVGGILTDMRGVLGSLLREKEMLSDGSDMPDFDLPLSEQPHIQ